MTTPIDEKAEPRYYHPHVENERSSEEEHTVIGDDSTRNNSDQNQHAHLNPHPIDTNHLSVDHDHNYLRPDSAITSPSASRAQASQLEDDLQMLQIERQISAQEEARSTDGRSMHRSRSRHQEPVDEFDAATNPLHAQASMYKPPENPTTNFAKFFKKIHNSSWVVRYLTYIVPVVCIILIPLLLGALLFEDASVGGVELVWFCIWLEIFWLTLWAGRVLAKCLPWPIGLVASIFTNNGKKWRDMGKQLELPATLFFWWLAVIISFYPTMTNHHIDGNKSVKGWEKTMYKVLVSVFVGFVLNFVEKIIIQLIAISFHLRTYQDRIELNKFQIGSLVKLYTYSKAKITMEDSEFEQRENGKGSGARTPGAFVKEAQKNTKQAITKFGDVAGRIAADFTGRATQRSNHPHQVVLALLGSTSGSQVLARRLYRTFAREETETVHSEDLSNAFDNEDEASAAFSMFDKDMNGDISMEELEAVCVEIGRERKAITASLKDLDSVISKLDDVLMFIVAVITILVFISLISSSAGSVISNAGSAVLALSWLFSATAQEFLQSIVFVFVKHPFDVGDRVTIYGNTGTSGTGDDYFVKEIALLYTEFKKMEGHVVQAPNSYLNTLFILNQRRSGGLAEAVPICIKFGTTLEQIDSLRMKLLDFVRSEKREYQGNILTELREVAEAHSLTLNVVFFYKSNWQNELLRLQRRNKFICAMMVSMQECGIEGPRMRFPGQKESFPVYLQQVPHIATPGMGHGGHPDNPAGMIERPSTGRSSGSGGPQDPPFVSPESPDTRQRRPSHSILRTAPGRPRGESLAAMGRRVDFSLGMKDISSGDMTGDVFDDPPKPRIPVRIASPADRGSLDSRTRPSHDTGRSTGHDSDLARIPTDSSAARSRTSHRNRFFQRGKNREDLEGGLSMHEIPETAERIDPRSGTISPAAWRQSHEESRTPTASGALDGAHDGSREFAPPKRSVTESFGLKRQK
ncbi:Mechanosensitive ion channel MscS [Macrophomina phaseolina MS6]|uniref:Mechanosensitive ion channel protein n=1 Tax=Macrophomina phaseolina (strain MS6) TaxID=1126212 RepID=K2RGX3_MACPH|nr:Mechanosensitive ion channel MscS [Macrophomina phaseolina MS6]